MSCCGKSKSIPFVDKVKSIANGWSNVIWPNKEIEIIAYKRIEICAECDENKKDFCLDCGCWIPAKARSEYESCENWNE